MHVNFFDFFNSWLHIQHICNVIWAMFLNLYNYFFIVSKKCTCYQTRWFSCFDILFNLCHNSIWYCIKMINQNKTRSRICVVAINVLTCRSNLKHLFHHFNTTSTKSFEFSSFSIFFQQSISFWKCKKTFHFIDLSSSRCRK